MSGKVGIWQPTGEVRLDAGKLRHFASLMSVVEGDDLTGIFSANELANEAALMTLDADAWNVANSLTDSEIIALVRFFTLAEMQFADWVGGKRSPVVYLVRILKRRDKFSPELRKWIKANTDNRYLPYGSVL